MNELLLLRHAKAAPHDLELPDHSRRLTDGGRESARRMRDEMERLGLQVDVVLVSSARRTMQTLQCLLPFITPNQVEPMDALYLATAADLLHVLRQVPPTLRTVLVIGHNPGLHELALLLGTRRPGLCGAPALEREFPTAALAQFTAPDDWGALGPRRARLVRFLRPQA